MLALLLALQMSTTNCVPDYTGGANCTTITTQPPELAPLPQVPSTPKSTRSSAGGGGLIGLIERLNDRKLSKKIGKLAAAGDCEGAAKLAFENGWLEVGTQIRTQCVQASVPAAGISHSANWLHVATDADGAESYIDMQSVFDEGGNRTVWEKVSHPAADSKRETSSLNIYSCSNRTHAVKMIVSTDRDGDVQSFVIAERDLKFRPILSNTVGEASFEVACALPAKD